MNGLFAVIQNQLNYIVDPLFKGRNKSVENQWDEKLKYILPEYTTISMSVVNMVLTLE